MAKRGAIVGLRGIDGAIRTLNGVLSNANDRAQDIAVAIVDHAANAGNGDMSRALVLVQTMKRHRTMNTAFIIGWFRFFGNCNINLRANDGAGKVSLITKDSKAYRGGFDVAGAKANKWYEAMNDDGTRARWYEGPEPADYVPDTIGDVAERITRFVKRLNDDLGKTKTVKGKEVPLIRLSDDDEKQLHNALQFVERIAATLARHEDVQQLAAKLAEATEAANQDDEVIAVIEPKEKAVA